MSERPQNGRPQDGKADGNGRQPLQRRGAQQGRRNLRRRMRMAGVVVVMMGHAQMLYYNMEPCPATYIDVRHRRRDIPPRNGEGRPSERPARAEAGVGSDPTRASASRLQRSARRTLPLRGRHDALRSQSMTTARLSG